MLFPRLDRVRYLGLFHEKQACFEHKPWVESQLSAFGVRVLPWRYCADHETDLIREWAAAQPLVLRTNRTDGGAGVRLVRNPSDLDAEWPSHGDGFLAAAPLLVPSVPLNVNGCLFSDGTVTLHGPSLQLIGIEGLTNRCFGYCGNDFARATDLGCEVLHDLETITVTAGHWLHGQGYRGAFGVDALLYDGRVHLTEVNPRFQGSSRMSAHIDRTLDRADVFLEHIAAFLDLPPSPQIPLPELAAAQPPLAHVIAHNVRETPISSAPIVQDEPSLECRLLPSPDVAVQPEGIAFEAVFSRSVTVDGMALLPGTREELHTLSLRLFPGATSG